MSAKLFQLIFYFVRLSYAGVLVSARIPLAQAMLESANWTSSVYKNTNNMFGMMFPSARQTTAISKDAHGYAVYRSAFDCVRDYFLWLQAFELTNDALLDARIASGKYAADKTYYSKITKISNQNDALMINPASLAAKTFAGVALGVTGLVLLKK